jgi:hypothetical protein
MPESFAHNDQQDKLDELTPLNWKKGREASLQ